MRPAGRLGALAERNSFITGVGLRTGAAPSTERLLP
jgi:hypothetical protein